MIDLRKTERREATKQINFPNRRRFDRRITLEEFKNLLFSGRKERIPGKSRIVITGIGVVAPNGIGKDLFWDNLIKGVSGIRPISLFNTESYNSKLAGEISGFKASSYLGKKGLRYFDRSTLLLNVALHLALEDSRIEISAHNTYDTGIVVGTTMGSVRSISEFDKSGLTEGPSCVNPAHFPNTVINAPASRAAIRYDIRGLNATISSGFCSALDAAIYAYDMINLNRVSTIFTSAVEELCHQTFLGFYKAECLAQSNHKVNRIEQSMPFDKRRNGVILGEGAGVLVFEELEHALERGATIYGEIKGFGRIVSNNMKRGAVMAMSRALHEAKVSPEEIDLICASANSSPVCDKMETHAIKEVFGEKAVTLPITAVKSMVGEGYSVSGSFQMMCALLALNKATIPPTINYQKMDKECDLDYVKNKCRSSCINKVMVNSFCRHSNYTSIILEK
ncbi:MAG: beta-ketoacyl-[acyl-carrier-protein] synthase family protein [bacterium]